jgi:hypothetical protein
MFLGVFVNKRPVFEVSLFRLSGFVVPLLPLGQHFTLLNSDASECYLKTDFMGGKIEYGEVASLGWPVKAVASCVCYQTAYGI